jgi:two-component system chemotaxis response regulator CheY
MLALIVDDSSVMRSYLRKILLERGFEVSEARDGVQGLDAVLHGPRPDLVLIDWHMPEMDGFDLLRSIRARPEFESTTLVMVTAENDLSQISLALDSGANEYMMKPLTQDIILEKLDMLGF